MGDNGLKKGPLVTIDGPAGAGKSTVSRILAKRLSCLYLDTGALYRAVACRVIREGISSTDEERIATLCERVKIRLCWIEDALRVYADGEDVTDEIRMESVSLLASRLSALPVVRAALLSIQREAGKQGGIIAEGRDMGTVVFPEADFKFFLDANVEERIRRRGLELAMRGERVDVPSLRKDLLLRDQQDRERTISPLKVPEGAMMIDSTHLSVDAVVEAMLMAIAGQ